MEPLGHRGSASWSEPPVRAWADALARSEGERLARVMTEDRARGIATEETVDRVLACLRRLTPQQRAIVAQRVFGSD
jgi:DNA-directed RNA polymerase specialized sigma24 family protein